MTPARPRNSSTSRHQTRVTPSQVIGEILLTIGVLVLLFVFYEIFWNNFASAKLQKDARHSLEQEWVNPRSLAAPKLGDAFAQMYIPSFGPDYQFAIIHGVDEAQLLAGPGHYPDTQLPGEEGNFAVAGHRVGKGAPFNDLGGLSACDAIVVETQTQWVTYRVLPMTADPAERATQAKLCLTGVLGDRIIGGDYAHVVGRHITTPDDVEVLNPIPESSVTEPSLEPSPELEGIITLTTCHPRFSNAQRMIIHAVQTEITSKTGATPAALKEVS